MPSSNLLVSAGVLLGKVRPTPAPTKGASRCQVFPPVRLSWRFTSANVTVWSTGPDDAPGQRIERVHDQPLQVGAGNPEADLDRRAGAEIVPEPVDLPVVRADLEPPAGAAELAEEGRDGVALPDVVVGRGLGRVAHLGGERGGDGRDEQRDGEEQPCRGRHPERSEGSSGNGPSEGKQVPRSARDDGRL